MASSLSVSSEDDESEEEDEEFITIKEFEEFKESVKKELDEVKQSYHKAIDENIILIKRLDSVDWRLIN